MSQANDIMYWGCVKSQMPAMGKIAIGYKSATQ